MHTNLYIMTGLPYSGKTTLSKALEHHRGLELVSVDRIMNDKNMWREGHPTQGDWNEAYTQAYRQIEEHLAAGKTVVFDCGNMSFRERENARNIARKAGVAYKLIYVKTPAEEILERRRVNETTRERGHLTLDMMDNAGRMFEEPRECEQPMIYAPLEDLTSWVRDKFE